MGDYQWVSHYIAPTHQYTKQSLYNSVSFLWGTHNRHPIAHPSGWAMGCLLWVQSLIYSLQLPTSCFFLHYDVNGLVQDCSNSITAGLHEAIDVISDHVIMEPCSIFSSSWLQPMLCMDFLWSISHSTSLQHHFLNHFPFSRLYSIFVAMANSQGEWDA